MGSPFTEINNTELSNIPEIIEQIMQWLNLLNLKTLLRRDKRDGAWVIALILPNTPDIFLELDYQGRILTFYSNVLTEFVTGSYNESDLLFLLEIMNKQSLYNTLRVCAGKSSNSEIQMIKIYSRYKKDSLDMHYLADLIREGSKFLTDIQTLIVEHNLPEIWRKTEGEPNTDKYNLNFHFEYS